MNNTTSHLKQMRGVEDYFYIRSPPIVAQFYLWGYLVIFILGFTGNIASFLTFIRPTLRSVSTGTLFVILAVSDTTFLFASIFDFIDFGLQIPLYGRIRYDVLCQFRVFVISMTQICSAWVLVTISIDRWIRTRFPHKSVKLCTSKRVLLVVLVIVIIDGAIHSPMLTQSFGMLLPGVALIACGPNTAHKFYLNFYYYTWTVLQVFINCLIPVVLMLIVLLDMFVSIRSRKKALGQQIHVQNQTGVKRDSRFQNQLFLLMLSSIFIFLITTLPLAVYRVVFPKQVVNMQVAEYPLVMSISAGLTWFWGFNYAVNFYIHCLTSKLFRKEFLSILKCLPQRNQAFVVPFTQTRISHFPVK